MTVAELIAYLEKLPKDTVIGVVYAACSDLSVLEEYELTFMGKVEYERERANLEKKGYPTSYGTKRYVLRNGQIMEYDERTWPKEETPNFVPILILPGN